MKNLEPGKWVEEMVNGKHAGKMLGTYYGMAGNSALKPAFGWILGSGDEQMESLSQT